jgi:sugar lactone lactonase YvrE
MLVVLPFAAAEAPKMKIVETADLQIVYFDPTGEYLVPYATQCFVNGLAAQKARFGFEPDGKVSVLLQDFSDRGNAAAIMGAPRDRIFVDLAPPTLSFETFSPGERMYTMANHELVHTVVGDQASSEDMRARHLLGGKVAPFPEHPESILYNYLTNPRASTPRWYHEGSAVFMETWYGGGLGRAQGGYDEMVFRAMVRDGATFYDPLGLVSKGTEIDFQAGVNAYLYGTRFMSYLALQYTPEKLIDWLRRADGTERYYASDFERVYGKSLGTAWAEWIRWEHEFQESNLAAVREHPITPYREITKRGLGAISRAYLSKDKTRLYAAVRYAGRVPYLVSIDVATGAVTELAEIKGAASYRVASLAYDPDSETLFYTTNNLTYRNIIAYDIKTGESRTLFKGHRIGDLAFNRKDRSLWGLRTNNGFVIVVRMEYPYTEWKAVHVYPFGEVPFDLDVSPDGELVSLSLAGPDGERSGVQVMQLRVMSTRKMIEGDATPLHKFELGTALPEGFTFSPDGRYLYGSSYYTGVSNIYRYELATEKLDAMSNAEVGYFRPQQFDDSHLLIFHYAAEGFVPAVIEAKSTEDLSAIRFLGEQIASTHPVVQQWGAGSPGRVDYAASVKSERAYEPAFEMSRESLYPIIEGYKDSIAFGGHARFSDPIGFDGLNLTVSYSPDTDLAAKERLHAAVDFRHFDWTAGLKWNAGDFYDLFGPTKRSREGYSAYVNYNHALIFDPPQTLYVVGKLAYFGDLDSLPGFQNVPSPTDQLTEAALGLEYKYPRASVGAVDDETGYLWSVMTHTYHAQGDFTPALLGKFDAGWPLGRNHASIWLRTSAGVASGSREDPLANTYFGGFRNNYVDSGEAKRYRDVLSMPGFEIDALNGRSFVKGMLELNLPPIRFEALGSPGFYGSWIRPALFTTALVTNPDSPGDKVEAFNVGLQLDLQLHVLNRLPMMLSLGYARGFEGDGQGEDEVMLSLKVL